MAMDAAVKATEVEAMDAAVMATEVEAMDAAVMVVVVTATVTTIMVVTVIVVQEITDEAMDAAEFQQNKGLETTMTTTVNFSQED